MKKPCVYQLWLGNRCVYVGQTVNFEVRILKHKDKNYDRVVTMECEDRNNRMEIEANMIQDLKPKLNVQRRLARNRTKGTTASGIDKSSIIGVFCELVI